MSKISEGNPIPPKFFMAKYPIPPKFDVCWEVSLIRKVRGYIISHGLSFYVVIEAYALKLSKSSALKFWMYAE